MPDRRIEMAAVRLRWAVLILWGCLVVAYVAGRLGLVLGPLHFESHASGERPAPPLIGDLSILLLSVALYQLVGMLAAVAGGDFFSARVVRGFRAFAFWLLLLTLLWLVAPILGEFLRDQQGPETELTFRLSIRDLLTVGIALILFLVARLLERARAIDDEMREIV